jgi:glyoxylase-like metal-dependent hydrolase (beta-lactamase superfamily II)
VTRPPPSPAPALRRRVGDVELLVLSDGLLRTPAERMVGAMPAEISGEFVAPDPHGDIWLGLNCVVIRTAERVIVVDTGFGDGPHGDDADLVRSATAGLSTALAQEGIDPADVNVVVNTHLHTDHCGGNLAWDSGVARPSFANAHYLVQQAELDWALSGDPATEALYAPEDVRLLAATGQLRTHDGDARIAPGISVMKAAGHTPGHQVIVVESRGDTAVVTGDLAPMRMHVRHPGWELPGDHVPSVAAAARTDFVRWARERKAAVMPYHEPDSCWVQLEEPS